MTDWKFLIDKYVTHTKEKEMIESYLNGNKIEGLPDINCPIKHKDGWRFRELAIPEYNVTMIVRKNELVDHTTVVESFYSNECYKSFDIEDGIVLDIGSSVGDSAILFSRLGARLVYAVEPDPDFFKLLIRNIEKNNISNVIPINEGISLEPGRRKVKKFSIKRRYQRMKMVKFDSLVQDVEYSLLKMDCEGAEFVLLDESPDILGRFDHIIIEYHDNPSLLTNHLTDSGFNVRDDFHRMFDEKPLGFLIASRKY